MVPWYTELLSLFYTSVWLAVCSLNYSTTLCNMHAVAPMCAIEWTLGAIPADTAACIPTATSTLASMDPARLAIDAMFARCNGTHVRAFPWERVGLSPPVRGVRVRGVDGGGYVCVMRRR